MISELFFFANFRSYLADSLRQQLSSVNSQKHTREVNSSVEFFCCCNWSQARQIGSVKFLKMLILLSILLFKLTWAELLIPAKWAAADHGCDEKEEHLHFLFYINESGLWCIWCVSHFGLLYGAWSNENLWRWVFRGWMTRSWAWTMAAFSWSEHGQRFSFRRVLIHTRVIDSHSSQLVKWGSGFGPGIELRTVNSERKNQHEADCTTLGV